MVRYVRCKSCKNVVRLLNGEQGCIYCGNDLAKSDSVTERVWRESMKGSQCVMQPFEYRDIKPSTQMTFVKELLE